MDNIGDHIVRVRGIPFSAGKSELQSFFAMCKIRNGKEGIHFTYLQHGRPSGEAFVEFDSEEELQKAIKMHKEYMGSRYIEVFIAQKVEWDFLEGFVESQVTTHNSLECALKDTQHFHALWRLFPGPF